MESYNKHYISVDEEGRVIRGFSDAFRDSEDGDICINTEGSYQFRLTPDGCENPLLFDPKYGVPLYKYEDGEIVKRTDAEIEADISSISVEESPTQIDRIEAQVTYTAMMTDTLLEV